MPQEIVDFLTDRRDAQMQSLVCASPADGGRLPVWEYEIGDTTYYHPLSNFTPVYEGSWDKETILAVFGETKLAVFTMQQLEDHPEWLHGLKTVLEGAIDSALPIFEDVALDQFGDVGTDARPALQAAIPNAIPPGSQMSAAARAGPRSKAKVPGQCIQGPCKRTVSQIETANYIETKRLKQSYESNQQHSRINRSHSSERVSVSDSLFRVSTPRSTNALETPPSNQIHNYIDAELQRPSSDEMPQYLDIDDLLTSVQREAGIPVTSKGGAQHVKQVSTSTTNETASQNLHIPSWIAQEKLQTQQAPPGCTSYPPPTEFLPSLGRNRNIAKGIPKHHAINSLQEACRLPKLDQHEAALAGRLNGTSKHSSPIGALCDEHVYGAEDLRLLPDQDMWSRYLSPEGMVELFVPDCKKWQPYFPPNVILSLFSSRSKYVAKYQTVDYERSTPQRRGHLKRQLELDTDGLELLHDKPAKKAKYSGASHQFGQPQAARIQAETNAPCKVREVFPYCVFFINSSQTSSSPIVAAQTSQTSSSHIMAAQTSRNEDPTRPRDSEDPRANQASTTMARGPTSRHTIFHQDITMFPREVGGAIDPDSVEFRESLAARRFHGPDREREMELQILNEERLRERDRLYNDLEGHEAGGSNLRVSQPSSIAPPNQTMSTKLDLSDIFDWERYCKDYDEDKVEWTGRR